MPRRDSPLSDDGEQVRFPADRPDGDPTPPRGLHRNNLDDAPTPPRGRRPPNGGGAPPHHRRDHDDETEITPARGIIRTSIRNAPSTEDDEDWDLPNDLVRRIGTICAILAVIAIGVFVARNVLGRTDDNATDDPSTWNTLAVLTDEGVSVVSRNGDAETVTYPLDDEPLDLQSEVVGGVLVTLADDGRIAQTDLGDGTTETSEAGRDQTLRVAPDNSSIALVASDSGGDVTVIDANRQVAISIAEATKIAEPLIFVNDVRINASGTHLAVAIPRLFQSFVIDLETSESTALAGRVLAIDDDRVVTEQPAGDQSEIEFYSLDGDRLGSVDVAAPRASMITPDGEMLLVTADGTIIRADPDGSEDVGVLADPDGRRIDVTGGVSAAGGERLVVAAENSVFVVDADGNQLSVVAGRLADPPPTVAAQCLIVATGTTTIGVTVIDLESGATLDEVDQGFVTATSTDGCTVATAGANSPQLLADGRAVDVDADAIIAVAPDGSSYVTVDGRTTSLVTPGQEPVVLADEPAIVRFGRR
jgi:hypothetical protein